MPLTSNITDINIAAPDDTITISDGTNTVEVTPQGQLKVYPPSIPNPSTSTVTAVASSATVVTLQAANANRKGLLIFNDSTKNMRIKLGTGASASNYSVLMTAKAYFEVPYPAYTGDITGIWESANGNALVTEILP
jgi:hypothetical protein